MGAAIALCAARGVFPDIASRLLGEFLVGMVEGNRARAEAETAQQPEGS